MPHLYSPDTILYHHDCDLEDSDDLFDADDDQEEEHSLRNRTPGRRSDVSLAQTREVFVS